MDTNDSFLEKVDNLNNKLLKLILTLYSINNFYGDENLKKTILQLKNDIDSRGELKNNIDSIKDIESVVYDSINQAGFDYDDEQGIFYSIIDAWQHDYGYCRVYDEFSAPLSMIFDCEPIYFDYNNKRWLIEFWKGQYGICTGVEVGVYASEKTIYNEIMDSKNVFYDKISPEEFLDIEIVVRKNGEVIFKRKDKHWWLTGFILGEFSEPDELSADISITLINEEMRDAFIQGLNYAGYDNEEIKVKDNSVEIFFDKPKTKQPYTNIKSLNYIMQRKNEYLCNVYNNITKQYKNYDEKINAVKKQSPLLYRQIMNIGIWKLMLSLYNVYKFNKDS